jgi:hypothetical protein
LETLIGIASPEVQNVRVCGSGSNDGNLMHQIHLGLNQSSLVHYCCDYCCDYCRYDYARLFLGVGYPIDVTDGRQQFLQKIAVGG